jgi:hypothetical protein
VPRCKSRLWRMNSEQARLWMTNWAFIIIKNERLPKIENWPYYKSKSSTKKKWQWMTNILMPDLKLKACNCSRKNKY